MTQTNANQYDTKAVAAGYSAECGLVESRSTIPVGRESEHRGSPTRPVYDVDANPRRDYLFGQEVTSDQDSLLSRL